MKIISLCFNLIAILLVFTMRCSKDKTLYVKFQGESLTLRLSDFKTFRLSNPQHQAFQVSSFGMENAHRMIGWL